jgi:hypothetical protein
MPRGGGEAPVEEGGGPHMRRAVMGSVMVGAIVSLLVRLAWSQAKDLDETITIWPTRGGSIR